jgi:hypothetical protein
MDKRLRFDCEQFKIFKSNLKEALWETCIWRQTGTEPKPGSGLRFAILNPMTMLFNAGLELA